MLFRSIAFPVAAIRPDGFASWTQSKTGRVVTFRLSEPTMAALRASLTGTALHLRVQAGVAQDSPARRLRRLEMAAQCRSHRVAQSSKTRRSSADLRSRNGDWLGVNRHWKAGGHRCKGRVNDPHLGDAVLWWDTVSRPFPETRCKVS